MAGTSSKANKSTTRKAREPNPRFLYRTASPQSNGTTNLEYVTSAASTNIKRPKLSKMNRNEAAKMLIGHLTWKNLLNDNLMSWTNSFLVALQLAIYRWRKDWGENSPERITIYILKMNGSLQMTFQPAEALITEYQAELSLLGGLENKTFHGEYLSQGKLDLREHHSRGAFLSFTLQDLIGNGLFELHPPLEDPQTQIQWVRALWGVRAKFQEEPQPCTLKEVFETVKLASACLPQSQQIQAVLAVAILTIVPRAETDKILLEFMAMTLIGNSVDKDMLDSTDKQDETMPEYNTFVLVLRAIYEQNRRMSPAGEADQNEKVVEDLADDFAKVHVDKASSPKRRMIKEVMVAGVWTPA